MKNQDEEIFEITKISDEQYEFTFMKVLLNIHRHRKFVLMDLINIVNQNIDFTGIINLPTQNTRNDGTVQFVYRVTGIKSSVQIEEQKRCFIKETDIVHKALEGNLALFQLQTKVNDVDEEISEVISECLKQQMTRSD